MNRILIVNATLTMGGLGRYTYNLYRGLTLKGYETRVCLTHQGFEQANYYHQSIGDDLTCFEEGNRFKQYGALLRLVWQYRPHVIVSNYNAPIHFLAPLLPTAKLIHVVHSDDPRFYRTATIQSQRTTAWVVPTPVMKDRLLGYADRCRAEVVHVIPHGVDLPAIDIEAKPIGKEVIFVGSLGIHKGINLLPEIIKQVAVEVPDVHFTIVGDGPDGDWLREELAVPIAAGVVLMTGELSPTDVDPYWNQADILLFPTTVESFGLVIAEAMARGVVPISSCLPGITDVVVGEGGVVIDEYHNADAFVKPTIELLRDATRLQSYRKRAVQQARLFSLDVMLGNYIDLIRKIAV